MIKIVFLLKCGWLGVKHQATYLLLLCIVIDLLQIIYLILLSFYCN